MTKIIPSHAPSAIPDMEQRVTPAASPTFAEALFRDSNGAVAFGDTGVFGCKRPSALPVNAQHMIEGAEPRTRSAIARAPVVSLAEAGATQGAWSASAHGDAQGWIDDARIHRDTARRLPDQSERQSAAVAGRTSQVFNADKPARSAKTPPPQSSVRAIQRARLQTSAVSVALQSTECGLRVFARAGRMSPTDEMTLRHAVSKLLAEHGYSGVDVEIHVAARGSMREST